MQHPSTPSLSPSSLGVEPHIAGLVALQHELAAQERWDQALKLNKHLQRICRQRGMAVLTGRLLLDQVGDYNKLFSNGS